MSISLNNVINHNSTIQTPNQFIYGFRTRETLNLLRYNDPEIENNPAPRNNTEIFDENYVFRNVAGIIKETATLSVFSVEVPINIYRSNHINVKNVIVFSQSG